jgi:hypothetical protein
VLNRIFEIDHFIDLGSPQAQGINQFPDTPPDPAGSIGQKQQLLGAGDVESLQVILLQHTVAASGDFQLVT